MGRFIPLWSVTNGRELGELLAADGRAIRKGMLLRTANLSALTDSDGFRLKEDYRLSCVIDLRTIVEQRQKPDALPSDVSYFQIPIFDEATAGITREDGPPTPFSLPDMVELYRTMIVSKSCQAALQTVLSIILSHDYSSGSILWHCTAGKDRCGIVSALVLSALGCDRSVIRDDYLVNDASFIEQSNGLYQKVLASGRPESVARTVADVFLALPKYIDSAFSAVDEFGGADRYLRDILGFSDDMIIAFQNAVLE